jgi:hypothetical protein
LEQYTAKFNELSLADKLIAVASFLMIVPISFLPWWHYSESVTVAGTTFGGSASESAWGRPGDIWSILVLLICVAMFLAVVLPKFANVALPDLGSITWNQAFGGGAAALVVLMLLKAWRIQAAPIGGFGWGFFLAIIAAAAIAYGGFLKYQESVSAGVRKA